MPSTIELRQTDPVVGSVADAVLCIDADELLNDIDSDLVSAVRKACTEHGFFYIDLSTAQRDSVSKTLMQMDHFFSLEDDDPQKRKTLQDDGEGTATMAGSQRVLSRRISRARYRAWRHSITVRAILPTPMTVSGRR